jgi:hypothetical protein
VLCPNCHDAIDPAALACNNGQQFAYEDGVLVVLEEASGQQLRTLTAGFSALREAENKRRLDVSAYEQLSFGNVAKGSAE